jgi:hypothetical protein
MIETLDPKSPCEQCGGPHPFDTSVPSVLWNEVIRAASLPEYLCLTCIVQAFVRADTSFTAELVGDYLPFIPIEVKVRSIEALSSVRLSDENTRLRSLLSSTGLSTDEFTIPK